MKNTKCADCDGNGKRTCSHCKGTNVIHTNVIKTGEPVTQACMWCRGELIEYCRTCNGSGWTESPEPQQTIERWQLHTEWIKIIKPVVAKQNRKNPPNKRLVTAIKAAFDDEQIDVYWYPDRYGFYEIVIIKTDNLHYTIDDKLTLSWSKGQDRTGNFADLKILDHPSWEKLDEELQREDPTDHLDRIEIEKTRESDLMEIDARIAELQEQIDFQRELAAMTLKDLPEPESATLRKGSPFAKEPSVWAKNTFPHIWPSK